MEKLFIKDNVHVKKLNQFVHFIDYLNCIEEYNYFEYINSILLFLYYDKNIDDCIEFYEELSILIDKTTILSNIELENKMNK